MVDGTRSEKKINECVAEIKQFSKNYNGIKRILNKEFSLSVLSLNKI